MTQQLKELVEQADGTGATRQQARNVTFPSLHAARTVAQLLYAKPFIASLGFLTHAAGSYDPLLLVLANLIQYRSAEAALR